MKEGIGEVANWNGTGVVQVKVEIEVQTGPGGKACGKALVAPKS
jgi:hypothetical protein